MSFEKLRVYQAALRLDKMVTGLIEGMIQRFTREADNLRRAVGAIAPNIAEAYGSKTPGRKKYFLRVARGSADETRAHLVTFVGRNWLIATASAPAEILARTISKMLTALIDAIPDA